MSRYISLVDQFVKDPSNGIMNKLASAARSHDFTDDEIAYLAQQLARSGTIIENRCKRVTADIASTGGPGSLSTILCPLFLNAFGFAVPKLGIPGRPAGGIDVLAQIPGYQFEPDNTRIGEIIAESGYVHFLASSKYAPLDATFFEYRKHHGVLNIPALVIASILAKKIAVGVECVGLDIRVGSHGNFGSTLNEARENAQRFCRVAVLVGIRAVCFLTDNRIPAQPHIGRGEALLATSHVFSGQTSAWLKRHVDTCYAMARAVADIQGTPQSRPSATDIARVFENNLRVQESSAEAFHRKVARVQMDRTYGLVASDDGFAGVDIGRLRDIITGFQNSLISDTTPFPDPCGVTLQVRPGDYVIKGQPLASIRLSQELGAYPESLIRQAIRVDPVLQSGILFEEVKYGQVG